LHRWLGILNQQFEPRQQMIPPFTGRVLFGDSGLQDQRCKFDSLLSGILTEELKGRLLAASSPSAGKWGGLPPWLRVVRHLPVRAELSKAGEAWGQVLDKPPGRKPRGRADTDQ
jgi:hypothetical protein